MENYKSEGMSSYHTIESFTPSACRLGHIIDPRAPILLGKGLGPKIFSTLGIKWNEIAAKSLEDYSNEEKQCTIQLVSALSRRVQSPTSREENLACIISYVIQNGLRVFTKGNDYATVHQAYVVKGGTESLDIAVVDSSALELSVHAMVELKWESNTEYPEIQCAAYAGLYNESTPDICRGWMPTCVLTRNHYRCGVAYGHLFDPKWAYSEVCEYQTEVSAPFVPGEDNHVLALLHFLEYLAYSSVLHKTERIGPEDLSSFADATGQVLKVTGPYSLVGMRVISGNTSDGATKILKFYQSQQAANIAVARSLKIAEFLEVPNLSPVVYTGMSEREGVEHTCVVAQDFIEGSGEVRYEHFVNLAEKISKLDKKGHLHGDVRGDNIILNENGTVTLVDCDWAASFGVARFPANVNPGAFDLIARPLVVAKGRIPRIFDWLCLADLLEKIGCTDAATAASKRSLPQIKSALAEKVQSNDLAGRLQRPPEVSQSNRQPTYLSTPLSSRTLSSINLCSFIGRVGDFYGKAIRIVPKEPNV